MQVRVRMYRQGLGDCFLLTFGTGAATRHVLIDCGTLGTTTNNNPMADVVAHIRATTNDHLHAVIATHEHKDHLSGFASRKADFGAIQIDRFWVAWTENPADQVAQGLKKYNEDLGIAAVMGVEAMRTLASAHPTAGGDELDRLADRAEKVLEFFGEGNDLLGANEFAPTVHAAMELVRTGFGTREAEYLKPGTLVDVDDWLPGFRVYVLGPPQTAGAIADTGEQGGGDLYPYPTAGIRAAATTAVRNAESREQILATDLNRDAFIRQIPFDQRFQLSDKSELEAPRAYTSYVSPGNAWRRVDADWLGFSSILALQLDNRTNNTSLVLAFERIADGKVLLFPADAMRGNWQSWSEPTELEWSVTDPGGTPKTVRTTDLLRRTVFYKVGHHSSHNATARINGLEKMEQNTLVSFIPLDRKVAKAKRWNTMPTRSLYKRLMEKCNGRVVRSDIGWVTETQETEFASMFTGGEWTAFQNEQQAAEQSGRIVFDPLFIDYVV